MSQDNRILDFYRGRSIFVTGGSGFMGKVLIEKLLHMVPSLGTVYVLLRAKRGLSPEQRLEKMRASGVFDRLRQTYPAALDKLCIVPGDLTANGLGIPDYMVARLAAEVTLVFHCAATLRLEAPLRDNVTMNTIGTLRCLDLARKLPRLEAFVHHSTAFCYPDIEVLDEKLYAPSMKPHKLIKLVEWLSDEQLRQITPSLLGPHPNCYTYSKRMAEWLVAEAYPELPVFIVRPTIVCPSYLEPIPGWVDNLNGPIGVMVGAGKGVIRTMLCNGSYYAQIVPVDIAINGIICATYKEVTRKDRSPSIPVYNINVGDQEPTTWGEVLKLAEAHGRKYPLAMPLWYPNGTITTNPYLHEFRRIMFHLVPAYIIDFLLLCFGQKRFMVRIQNRISQGLEVLQYFTMRPWYFKCDNFDSLYTMLTPYERKILKMKKDEGDSAEKYMMNAANGGRVCFLKEDPKKIPLNRIHHNILYVLDRTIKVLFWLFVASLLVRWCEPLRDALKAADPLPRHLPFLGNAVFPN